MTDELYSDSMRRPDEQLAVPGRPFPGPLTNPTTGARVLSDPPNGTTNAGMDTQILWRTRVYHMLIQNNTAFPLYVDIDVPASQGSIMVGAGLLLSIDTPCDELHMYTPTAQPYNGTLAGAIVIRGWQ